MKENHNKDNILFYFVLFSFIVSILLGLVILIIDFMKGPVPNYLKYGFKTTEVKKMYQKKYVSEIQEYIQTTNLPDVTIKVDHCSYTEYNKAYGVPVYQLDFTYSSHTVDDYYESAIDSKRGAKDLFYKILEVNSNKNYYENESKIFWNGEPFESEGRMVLFQEDDRFIMKLSGDKHNYEIENQQYYDKLTIDGELVYELNKPGPSTYTPSKPKKEYNSYESSGSSSSYNDGYNSAVDDGDYDHDRYHTDPSYRQGVDDGFDETGEDY